MKKVLAAIVISFTAISTLQADSLHEMIRQGKPVTEIDKIKQEEINQLDDSGHTSLFYAVLNQNDSLVEALLKNGALTEVDDQTIAPLWLATVQGNMKMIELLLKHNAKPLAISNKGFSPIGAAIISGQVEILRLLAEDLTGDDLLKHFSSDMQARTHGDTWYIQGEGMSYQSAVRDAIRAKHTSMALFLLEREVPLLSENLYPGGYGKNTPFCLFEAIQNQCITVPLAKALIKAGENPFARVTSLSNISRSPMMPTSAMEAVLLVGPYDVAQYLAVNTEPSSDDYVGNLQLFGDTNISKDMNALGRKHFGKQFEGTIKFPLPPEIGNRPDSSIHAFSARLIPVAKADAEVFSRSEEKTKIAVFAIRGAEKYVPYTSNALAMDDMWTVVDAEEIRKGLDADYWESDQVEAAELAKAVDARVICVIEILKQAKDTDTFVCHLISAHSGLCVMSLRKRATNLDLDELRHDLTNAWRQWMDRCEMMQGKFHAIVCADNPEHRDLTDHTMDALRSAPHVLPTTIKQADIMKGSAMIRTLSSVKTTVTHDRDTIKINMQIENADLDQKIVAQTMGAKMLQPNLVKNCFCQLSSDAKQLDDIATPVLDRFMQRMFSTGYYEDSLTLANILQKSNPNTTKYAAFRRSNIEKRIVNFEKFTKPPAGIRDSFYPIVPMNTMRRVHEFHPLMLDLADVLRDELETATTSKGNPNNVISPRALGEKLRLLGYYRFYLRVSILPEFMDQMDAAISQLLTSACEYYKNDEQRLQLCIGITGYNHVSIAQYDLHRCIPLRNFVTSEIFRLSKIGIAKSATPSRLYFTHSDLGICYRKVTEATSTAQARGSWDPILGASFEELHQEKNGTDPRMTLDRDFYRADEKQRPVLARKIAALQCQAMRANQVTFFTGVPLLDLSRYVPISLQAPKLIDRTEWNKVIVADSLDSDQCNGELFWHAKIYHTEASVRKQSDKKTSSTLEKSEPTYLIQSKAGVYDLAPGIREKIYFSILNSAGTIDNMKAQCDLLQKENGKFFGEKKNIPDITAPDAWEISQKISLLDDDGSADVILPLRTHFDKTTNTLYFSCTKTRGKQKITLFDRGEIKSTAELISLNLKTGEVARIDHPNQKMESQFLIQSNFGHILAGTGNSIFWLASRAEAQMAKGANLSLQSLNVNIPRIGVIGNSHATLGDVCFVQIEDEKGVNMTRIEKRSKVLGFKPDGSVFTVVDTKQSPTASELDEPSNHLEGVFASDNKLHIFTNQSVTYQRVNPMMGICDATGKISEVEKDANKVTSTRTAFTKQIHPLSAKFPLAGGGFLYKTGLPGRMVIENSKGKLQALPIALSGLDEQKLLIDYPIHGANYSIESSDVMPVSDFARTIILRPQVVAETEDAFFLCAAFWETAYLPYVWRMKKIDLQAAMNKVID